jgi:hypothetical protein
MQTGVGQRFEGQIDPQNVLKGEVIGASFHDAMQQKALSWSNAAIAEPKGFRNTL